MNPKKLGTMQTVDMETDEVTSVHNAMTLLPPAGDVCQECAASHNHDQPHNAQSLYYQSHFYSRWGRWPTWTDAMAHCTDELKTLWRAGLVKEMQKHGMEIPEDLREGAKGIGR